MINILHKIKNFIRIRIAKNPFPELEKQIDESTVRLTEQVSLLRLSNSELLHASKNLRFGVMQELVDDIARSK